MMDDPFTRREHEVLDVMLAGLFSASEIAEALRISPRTVERHLQNMRTKIGAPSKAVLLHKVKRNGWVEPDE